MKISKSFELINVTFMICPCVLYEPVFSWSRLSNNIYYTFTSYVDRMLSGHSCTFHSPKNVEYLNLRIVCTLREVRMTLFRSVLKHDIDMSIPFMIASTCIMKTNMLLVD